MSSGCLTKQWRTITPETTCPRPVCKAAFLAMSSQNQGQGKVFKATRMQCEKIFLIMIHTLNPPNENTDLNTHKIRASECLYTSQRCSSDLSIEDSLLVETMQNKCQLRTGGYDEMCFFLHLNYEAGNPILSMASRSRTGCLLDWLLMGFLNQPQLQSLFSISCAVIRLPWRVATGTCNNVCCVENKSSPAATCKAFHKALVTKLHWLAPIWTKVLTLGLIEQVHAANSGWSSVKAKCWNLQQKMDISLF